MEPRADTPTVFRELIKSSITMMNNDEGSRHTAVFNQNRAVPSLRHKPDQPEPLRKRHPERREGSQAFMS
jgi:hypothetical protein